MSLVLRVGVIFINILVLLCSHKCMAASSLLIDAGHSPKSPGATSCTGKSEYIYNSALSECIFSYLKERGRTVFMTRQVGDEISLIDRASMSRKAALFLSIHHDSVQPQFIRWTNKRPSSTKAAGYSIFVSKKNRDYKKSLIFARRLGVALQKRGLMPSQHHGEKIVGENRQIIDSKLGIYHHDDLIVLKHAEVPSVLLEAAVIVNPKDEVKASSKSYQRSVAEAVEMMLAI